MALPIKVGPLPEPHSLFQSKIISRLKSTILTPERNRLRLLELPSAISIELREILKNPFQSHEAPSLLKRVFQLKRFITTLTSATEQNLASRALDLASDPILHRNPSLQSKDSQHILTTLINLFSSLSIEQKQPDPSQVLLNQSTKAIIEKKFPELSLVIQALKPNHHLFKKASKRCIEEAFSYISTPLETLITTANGLLPESTFFSIPRNTSLFFLHALRESFPRITKGEFPTGSFGVIQSCILGQQKFVLKATQHPTDLTHQSAFTTKDHERQLRIESVFYMAFWNNPNILKLEAYSENKLFLELAEQDFFTLLDTQFDDSPSQLRNFFYQIAQGLASLHRVGAAYEDLKLENILVTTQGGKIILKFCDLAFAAQVGTIKEGFEGTLEYLPPSKLILLDSHKTIKSPPISTSGDCWAFGVVMHLFISGQLPFYANISQYDIDRASKLLQREYPHMSTTQCKKKALQHCREFRIKNLINRECSFEYIFFNLPHTMSVTIKKRDPSGFFQELIRRCFNGNDAERITIEEILIALENAPESY